MNALLQSLVSGEKRASPAADPIPQPPKPKLLEVRYSHKAMIDYILANPGVSQNELGRVFNKTASWISTIIRSDVFQAALAERRDEIIDPELRLTIKEQLEGLHARSLEILRHKLDAEPKDVEANLALRVAQMTGQNLGLQAPRVSVQETHVHLEELGANLVGLLHRKRAEVTGVTINAEATEVRPAPSP